MRNLVILSFFISLVVLVMSVSIYFYYTTPLSEYSYDTTAFVTYDVAGFDVNTSSITFGSIVPGGTSTRSLIVNNSYPFPIKVEPKVDGSIRRILSFDQTIIEPYQTSKVYLTVSADSIDLLGNYTGNIIIKLVRA
ncbi:hypothetical protein FJZ21_00855 [Candidatus Pacearchaeota archaeon]|nr:hypothetical protein [Candidatus Pacearchaeota archaeon]